MICMGSISAQQVPLYSQYYFNKMLFNPAYTGGENTFESYLVGRRQWTGLNGYETKSFSMSGTPEGRNIGLGVYYVNDVNSILNTNSVYGNYAYNLKLSDNNSLTFGLSLGVIDSRYDLSNVVVGNQDDPVLRLLNARGGAVMDGSIGAVANFGDFHIGGSVLQLFNSTENFIDEVGNQIGLQYKPHYILSTGYAIPIGDDMHLEPMLMYRGVNNAPGQFDVNLMFDWDDKGWLGMAYRDDYALTFMAGLELANRVRVGYNYDLSVGEYSSALGGSHEFMLGYKFKKPAPKDPNIDKDKDRKINALANELDALKKRKPERDTVVIIQKVPATPSEEKIPSEKVRKEEPAKVQKTQPAPTDGFFILVVGAFTESANAVKYSTSMNAKGLNTNVFYNKSNNTYYVHLGSYKDKEKARADLKTKYANQKAWIKTVE